MVGEQVLGPLRAAVGVEVLGRRADEPPARCESPGHEARLRERSDTHHHIEPFFHDVDETVRELDLDLERRVGGSELRDRLREVGAPGKYHRGPDAQHTARLCLEPRDRLLGLLDLLHHRLDALAESAPGVGERDAARRAVEQPGAEPVLERADLLAHRGGCEAEPVRGPREALLLGDSRNVRNSRNLSVKRPRPQSASRG